MFNAGDCPHSSLVGIVHSSIFFVTLDFQQRGFALCCIQDKWET